MPLLGNIKPNAPSAPNDMTIAECYTRLDSFLEKNKATKNFKIEDDNHGMGMISTADDRSPKAAINVRLDEPTIRNYLLNKGFRMVNSNLTILSKEGE